MRPLVLAILLLAGRAAAGPLQPGDIVVADLGTPGAAGGLFRIPTGGGTPEAIATNRPLQAPGAVAIDAAGTLFVTETVWHSGGHLVRIDPASGDVTILTPSPPLFFPIGVAIAPDGRVLVTDLDAGSRLKLPRGELAGTGAFFTVDPTTGTSSLLAIDCCTFNAAAVTVDPTGDAIVVDLGFMVFQGNGALARVDRSTGVIRPIHTSEPLFDPSGVVADDLGTLYVTEATQPQPGPGAILAIEPTRGIVTTIATGAPIIDPRGIAMDTLGRLVVADSGSGAIYRVDPLTGEVTTLAAGSPLATPYGVAIVRDRQDAMRIP